MVRPSSPQVRTLEEAVALAESWSHPPFAPETIAAALALLRLPAAERSTAILDRFGYDLSFGTAGMRAIMDIGTARTNIYTIARVSAAVAKVIGSGSSVVIGFDGRKDSQKFARIAQATFLGAGVNVFAFDKILP